MIVDSFYRLHFGGCFEWSHVEVSEGGMTMESLHLSDATRRALTISDRAACGLAGQHDEWTIPGTRRCVCLRCFEVMR